VINEKTFAPFKPS